jgi:hypothetical protein
MPRQPRHITHAGRMWFAHHAAAPERRRNAEHQCGSPAHGVREGARSLNTDEATASRRHEGGAQ